MVTGSGRWFWTPLETHRNTARNARDQNLIRIHTETETAEEEQLSMVKLSGSDIFMLGRDDAMLPWQQLHWCPR